MSNKNSDRMLDLLMLSAFILSFFTISIFLSNSKREKEFSKRVDILDARMTTINNLVDQAKNPVQVRENE